MLRITLLSALLVVTIAGSWSPMNAAPGPITLFTLDGEPGFGYFWGETQAQVPPDGPVLVPEYSTRNRVVFLKMAEDKSQDIIAFGAPLGEDLAVATYAPDAYPEPGQPGMDVPCGGYADGRFTVHEISWAGGELERFAVTYAYSCTVETGGPPGREYRGEVRYQSTVDVTAIKLSPQSIDFPERFTDTVSNARTVTIRNPGTVPLELTSVQLQGDNPAQFELTDERCSGKTVQPGGQCTFDVIFAPLSGGPKAARVVVADNTTHFGRHWVNLTGIGVVPTPDAYIDWGDPSFADRHVGSVSEPEVKLIHSRGNVPVELDTVSLSGPGKDNFVLQDDTCSGIRLPVGESCSIKVRFRPLVAGRQTAQIRVSSNDPGSPDLLEISAWALAETSSVGLKKTSLVGPTSAWNTGSGLATTQSTQGSFLHAVYTTPRVNGKWVRDRGPHLGVMVIRRATNGATWSSGLRVNPTDRHGDRVVVAGSGPYVYAAWVELSKVIDYRPSLPRTVYFRAAAQHGQAGAWRSVVRLSPSTGRVDYPTIAAAGPHVYVAWTNASNGEVKLAISHDRGRSWTKPTVGTALASYGEGRAGFPAVAADGDLVAITWLQRAGVVVARISTDAGATWTETTTLTGALAAERARQQGIDAGKSTRVSEVRGTWVPSDDMELASSTPSVDVLASRVAFGWTTASTLKVRVWEAGTWSPIHTAYGNAEPFDAIESLSAPAVALSGTDAVGVAFSVERSGGDSSMLMWVETADDAEHWYFRKVVGDVRPDDRIHNDWPSVAWPWADKRVIIWNASGKHAFRLLGREASGSP